MEEKQTLLDVITFLENVRNKINENDVHVSEKTFSAYKLILEAEHMIVNASDLLDYKY